MEAKQSRSNCIELESHQLCRRQLHVGLCRHKEARVAAKRRRHPHQSKQHPPYHLKVRRECHERAIPAHTSLELKKGWEKGVCRESYSPLDHEFVEVPTVTILIERPRIQRLAPTPRPLHPA